MNFLKDYIIQILSLFGSIASIASIYFFDEQDQGKVALIVLGILLAMSMCHDWYYSKMVRQKNKYVHIAEDMNNIYSQIRLQTDDLQQVTNSLASICEALSTVFSEIHGKRIGVCIKLLTEVKKNAVINTHVRDRYSQTHGRKTGKYESTKHLLEENSDFCSLYEQIESNIGGTVAYYNEDVAIDPNYSNTSLNNWKQPTWGWPIINNYLRKRRWPLPYRSTIVIPIIPLDSNNQYIENLRGFLCLDSPSPKGFNADIDIEILRGTADELCPLIDKLKSLT